MRGWLHPSGGGQRQRRGRGLHGRPMGATARGNGQVSRAKARKDVSGVGGSQGEDQGRPAQGRCPQPLFALCAPVPRCLHLEYICMYTYIRALIHAYIHIYIGIHVYIYKHVRSYSRIVQPSGLLKFGGSRSHLCTNKRIASVGRIIPRWRPRLHSSTWRMRESGPPAAARSTSRCCTASSKRFSRAARSTKAPGPRARTPRPTQRTSPKPKKTRKKPSESSRGCPTPCLIIHLCAHICEE
jgi:hypothetical protein